MAMRFQRSWDFDPGNKRIALNDLTQDQEVIAALQEALSIAITGAAHQIPYSNLISQLQALNVQAAIDEVYAKHEALEESVSGVIGGAGLSAEGVMDLLGTGALVGEGVTLDYDDVAGTITMTVEIPDVGLDTEAVMDHLGTTGLVGAGGVSLSYDDVTGIITITSAESSDPGAPPAFLGLAATTGYHGGTVNLPPHAAGDLLVVAAAGRTAITPTPNWTLLHTGGVYQDFYSAAARIAPDAAATTTLQVTATNHHPSAAYAFGGVNPTIEFLEHVDGATTNSREDIASAAVLYLCTQGDTDNGAIGNPDGLTALGEVTYLGRVAAFLDTPEQGAVPAHTFPNAGHITVFLLDQDYRLSYRDAIQGAGAHADRPAATSLPDGALYSCTEHSLIYQVHAAAWSTWATLGAADKVEAVGTITKIDGPMTQVEYDAIVSPDAATLYVIVG